MKNKKLSLVVLTGLAGITASVSASVDARGNRGLSPIISIGICQLIESPLDVPRRPGVLTPALGTRLYFRFIENREIIAERREFAENEFPGVQVSVIEQPAHGILERSGSGAYFYTAESGFFGKDRVTFSVEIGGFKVKAVYFLDVMGGVADTWHEDKKYCPKGMFWKISTTNDANGNLMVTSVDYQSPITYAGTFTTNTATLSSSVLDSLAVEPSAIIIRDTISVERE